MCSGEGGDFRTKEANKTIWASELEWPRAALLDLAPGKTKIEPPARHAGSVRGAIKQYCRETRTRTTGRSRNATGGCDSRGPSIDKKKKGNIMAAPWKGDGVRGAHETVSSGMKPKGTVAGINRRHRPEKTKMKMGEKKQNKEEEDIARGPASAATAAKCPGRVEEPCGRGVNFKQRPAKCTATPQLLARSNS